MEKKKLLLLLFCSLLLCAFTKRQPTTLWMMGDSTMAIKDADKYPETGWGVPFATLFKPSVRVRNMAKNGRSTRSFIDEGRWQEIYNQLKSGDYLFIQFGHNDEKVNKPKVGTDIATFKANLSMFVEKAREKGAEPVLLTSIARRNFEQGVLVDTHKGYPAATREVADSLQVPLIDLTEKTNRLLTKLGERKSEKLFLHLKPGHKNYPEGVVDNTHLNKEGAMAVAKLAVEGIKELKLSLVKEFK
ncbi:rhamnogalacturonan acetylesterase [Olivibacter sp. SA151]|uniref:rhamnogalacturonan acetylesterase n=1 Tax=Olivibacter jilunii TaxID=985016 RepID=UPI003F14897F